jgi:hypothetical protein
MPSTTPDPLPAPLPDLAVVSPEALESDAPEADPNLDPAAELADLIAAQAREIAGEGLSMRPRRGVIRECDLTANRNARHAALGESSAGLGLDALEDDRPPLRFVFLDPPSASGLWAGGGGAGAGAASSNPTPSTVKPTARPSTTKPSTSKPTACPVCGGHPEASGRRAYCLACDKAASDGRVTYGGLDVGAVMNPGWGATTPTRYAPPERVEVPRGQAEGKGQVGQVKPRKGQAGPLRGGLG